MTTFSNDELILTLISLVRAIDPQMLQQGPDGFTVDLGALEKKETLTADEQLLVKLRAAFGAADAEGNYAVELSPDESGRLVTTLGILEKLQPWPEDVQALCNGVRARLGAT